MREKLAWAAERGIALPAHAARFADAAHVEAAPPAKARCCSKAGHPMPPVAGCEPASRDSRSDSAPGRWVAGFRAQQCQGQAFAGLGVVAPALPPAEPEAHSFAPAFAATLAPLDDTLQSLPQPPVCPPPRA